MKQNCLKKKPGITNEEFRRFCQNGELCSQIKTVAEASGARKYNLSLILQIDVIDKLHKISGSNVVYDAVIEYVWETGQHIESLINSEQTKLLVAEMLEYQEQFVDLANSSSFFTQEEKI